MPHAAKNEGHAPRWLGGEMELDPDTLARLGVAGVCWPYLSWQTITSGRTGLRLIAQMLKSSLQSERGVLLPAYTCPSTLQAFREDGISVMFYRIHSDLNIDLDDLFRLVKPSRPGALLFINYFGFPVTDVAASALREVKERCWVIEDCAQGSLVEQGEPVVGHIGHFAITSFRKYLPLPDGGLIINRAGVTLPALPPATGQFVRRRLLGKLLRHEFLQGIPGPAKLEEAYLALFAGAESELDSHVPLQAMSRISETLLGVIDRAEAMERRRRNFMYLLRAFSEEPQLESIGMPVFRALPRGVSPLIFPIRAAPELRDALRERLMGRRVFCPIHWDLPRSIDEARFPDAYRLSREILGLPIDQRYDEGDMKSLIERLVQSWREIR